LSKYRRFNRPFQELGGAVDLIVMLTVWKGQELQQESVEPIGLLRQMYMLASILADCAIMRSTLLPSGF
jgi:hypothetical protein